MLHMLEKTPWDNWPVMGTPEAHRLVGKPGQRIHPDRAADRAEREVSLPCHRWVRQDPAAPGATRRAASSIN